jgi:hypothetical protein
MISRTYYTYTWRGSNLVYICTLFFFCILDLFRFYFHKYFFCSFILKIDPSLGAVTISAEIQRVGANYFDVHM